MERKATYITKLISANDEEGLKDAAAAIRSGEVVGIPTETVYGLGGNAFDAQSVKRIYEAKGRPGDNPLIVHIWSKEQIPSIASEVTPLAQKLMDNFMPGPITVIVKRSANIPDEVTAGLDTVGIRMPSHKVARKFLELCDVPVAAPSANLSGSPSPTSARHVMEDMSGYIYAVVDGGSSDVGLESTVVDATGNTPVILRPGAVTKEMIDKVCGIDNTDYETLQEGQTPKAPGMKYRHYAPGAEVEIVMLPKEAAAKETIIPEDGDLKKMSDEDKQILFSIVSPYIMKCREVLASNPMSRIGIFAGKEVKTVMDSLNDSIINTHVHYYLYGNSSDSMGAAHYLFDGLRHLDAQEVNLILAVGFEGEGIEEAYMNRLNKAAGKKGETPEGASNTHIKRGESNLDDFDDVFTSSVLFVCDDNINMSSACEAIFNSLLRQKGPFCLEGDMKVGAELYCESAGLTGYNDEEADVEMIKAMQEVLGISMKHHRTSLVDIEKYSRNDLVLTLRDSQVNDILDTYPDLKGKVFSLSSFAAANGLVFKNESGKVISVSIPDPCGETYATFVHTVKALKAWLEILFPYILKELKAEIL